MSPTMHQAPSASGTRDLENHSHNVVDFPTAHGAGKAIATQIAKLALAGHAVHKGQRGDFIVCKYGLSRYCQDFAELEAFARQLGIKQ